MHIVCTNTLSLNPLHKAMAVMLLSDHGRPLHRQCFCGLQLDTNDKVLFAICKEHISQVLYSSSTAPPKSICGFLTLRHIIVSHHHCLSLLCYAVYVDMESVFLCSQLVKITFSVVENRESYWIRFISCIACEFLAAFEHCWMNELYYGKRWNTCELINAM